VFEREVSRKRVGHSFILAGAGLKALMQLGLGDAAASCGRPLRAYELFAPDGTRLLTTALSSARGIRRQELLDVLEAAVPPGVVELGRAVDALEYDADGVARAVRFTEG
jgi:2-polyprenyl-6-methoxyphenol hydroxylase-like FAD-dependent oxidoreductase